MCVPHGQQPADGWNAKQRPSRSPDPPRPSVKGRCCPPPTAALVVSPGTTSSTIIHPKQQQRQHQEQQQSGTVHGPRSLRSSAGIGLDDQTPQVRRRVLQSVSRLDADHGRDGVGAAADLFAHPVQHVSRADRDAHAVHGHHAAAVRLQARRAAPRGRGTGLCGVLRCGTYLRTL